MELSIRNAELNDFESIAELSKQLGYNTNNFVMQKRLAEILKSDGNCVFVAVYNEKIVGWVHGFYTQRIESDAFVEIGGLVVNENYWKRGIGKMLVEVVGKWAKSRNCKTLRVRCNTLRTESHKFYEKAEFQLNKEQKIFDRQLPERVSI